MLKNYYRYPTEIVEDIFGESPKLAETIFATTRVEAPRMFIAADYNVVNRHEGLGAKIGRYVREHGIGIAGSPEVFSGGEKVKADGMQSLQALAGAMLEAKLGAGDCVVAIGGGTVLDLAGYAAAQVRGGVKLVRVPTTPAAMIDAAFAEYAAIDSQNVKDAMRVASVPEAVLTDLAFAPTVLDGVWRAGFGEAIRLAVALDASLFKKLLNLVEGVKARDDGAMREAIELSVEARLKRGNTNLGLWSAIRLESMSGYKLPHGYAVPMGICVDANYAVARGLLKPEVRDEIVGALANSGALDGMLHSQHLVGQIDRILYGLDAWKLTNGVGEITLPTGIGKSTTEAEPDRELFGQAIKEAMAVFK